MYLVFIDFFISSYYLDSLHYSKSYFNNNGEVDIVFCRDEEGDTTPTDGDTIAKEFYLDRLYIDFLFDNELLNLILLFISN